MLAHDLSVAFRGFARNRQHSVISVCVLALGIICFVAAYIFVTIKFSIAHTDRFP